MDNPSRRRTFEYPKPETGLAEWTSKIKALQREVDADEEVEQKRLEDEIRMSRMARTRRSIGMTSESPDSSGNAYVRKLADASPVPEQTNREKAQSDALRKLMGANPSPTPDQTPSHRTFNVAALQGGTAPALIKTQSNPSPSNTEAISLAAFMGGRATGPRLNRHAPQQDAHDPTQFEQRTRASEPHPVFGRGGVAMPGMTASSARRVSPPAERDDVRQDAKSPPERSWMRERTMSTPVETFTTGVKAEVLPRKSQDRQRSTERPAESHYGRSRTPNAANNPPMESTQLSSVDTPIESPQNVSVGPLASSQRSFPPIPVKPVISEQFRRPISQERAASRQYTPPPQTFPDAPKSPHTPHTPRASSSQSPPPPIAISSLARPIAPQVRPSPTGPQIPSSQNPSPAFLKPPAQKDPTPSLSRLQGRGFVQSLVKMSSELQAAATGTQSPDRPGSATKRASVLDRWQPNASTSTSAPASPAYHAPPMRKSKTVDTAPMLPSNTTSPSLPEERRKALKSVASLGQLSQAQSVPPSVEPPKSANVRDDPPSPAIPGLGSSNTMISYIKPMKTGDDPKLGTGSGTPPQPPAEPPVERSDVDELGVRTVRLSDVQKRERSQSEVPPGRPLSHPTKDRARRPRKGGNARTRVGSTEEMRSSASADKVTVAFEDGAESAPVPAQPVINIFKEKTSQVPPQVNSAVEDAAIGHDADYESRRDKPTPTNQAPVSNVRRLMDSWADQAPIGIKPVGKAQLVTPTPTPLSTSVNAGSLTKQTLPGLVSPPPTPPLTTREEPKSPPSPGRHTRIPVSGTRATVMDVAQAMSARHARAIASPPESSSDVPVIPETRVYPASEEEDEEEDEGDVGRPDVKTQARNWGRTITPATVQAERRRSSYEKYSAIMMPPLHEEKTPVPSPAGTLSKSAGADVQAQTETNVLAKNVEVAAQPSGEPHKESAVIEDPSATSHNEVRFEHADEPLPPINARDLWSRKLHSFTPNPDIRMISVEVLSITGSTATAVTDEDHVFYDAETLAIVHRAKAKSTGLVSTQVWSWRGIKSEAGEKEERKMQELAKRFNADTQRCKQFGESQELLHVLGGTLALRQGTRSLWSAENTTMHVIRSWKGFILIDEVDLSIRNLCSGFSYCISVLDTLWVWHGRGSTDAQRQAALVYSKTLAGENKSVVEVEEGEEDEMFWMFLGEDGYASADYWKWRKHCGDDVDPRIWRVDCTDHEQPVKEYMMLPVGDDQAQSILLISLVYEIFVVVGPNARERRTDIRLALSVAQEISAHTAQSRPFTSPVHVIILPSQLPIDLCAAVRGLNNEALNVGDVPEHMNILTGDEALGHLRKSIWRAEDVKDESMLPLGVGPSVP